MGGRGRCLYGVRGSSRLEPVGRHCETGHQPHKEYEPRQPRRFSTKVETPKDKDLSELALSFNTMVSEVDKLMRENIEKERERLNMEQTALNSQINSHFLYNTLNTVKWMAVRAGNEEIARMVVALVNMLEYSCKRSMCPFSSQRK